MYLDGRIKIDDETNKCNFRRGKSKKKEVEQDGTGALESWNKCATLLYWTELGLHVFGGPRGCFN